MAQLMDSIDWRRLHGDAFLGKRVLVTGGAGFIGAHLSQTLARLGAHVRVIDDFSAARAATTGVGTMAQRPAPPTVACPGPGTIEWFEGDICDTSADSALGRAIDGCSLVFHLAALGSVPRSVTMPAEYLRVNAHGTFEVLSAARRAGVSRVIYSGSSSAYGDPPTVGPKQESMPGLPKSPYAAFKLAGEHTVRAFWHSYGLDGVTLRYFNIFGPRQNPHSAYAAVIAAFARRILDGQGVVMYGDGSQSRDFTYVANAVYANLLAGQAPGPLAGEVFNVGTGRRTTVRELFERLCRLAGREVAVESRPMRDGDVMQSLACLSKSRQGLGYEPIVSLEDGLADTLAWYREGDTIT